MAGWSPPSPSQLVLATVALLGVAVLAYSVLIQGAVLIGLFPLALVVGGYVVWRFLVALEAIADGVHRIADQRERE